MCCCQVTFFEEFPALSHHVPQHHHFPRVLRAQLNSWLKVREWEGTPGMAATKTWVCNSYNVNECHISKMLLPRYCGSVDQAAVIPFGSRKLAAEPVSSYISHSQSYSSCKITPFFLGYILQNCNSNLLKIQFSSGVWEQCKCYFEE